MFGKKPTKIPLTYIAQGTQLQGDTGFTGDALIGGCIRGNAQSKGHVTIETGGLIDGTLHCKELKVAGQFIGKLHCDKLIITSNGIVEGEVYSNSMEIFDGGQFIGRRIRENSKSNATELSLINTTKISSTTKEKNLSIQDNISKKHPFINTNYYPK